tara:strand:+ start:5648 stop:5836 length:189 start_codon:yes stop_codon:yes gene_type:complete
MKTNKPLIPRGIRISQEDWLDLRMIAEEQKLRTGEFVTASDIARHAIGFFLADKKNKERNGK